LTMFFTARFGVLSAALLLTNLLGCDTLPSEQFPTFEM
jgi:hypothetical protein